MSGSLRQSLTTRAPGRNMPYRRGLTGRAVGPSGLAVCPGLAGVGWAGRVWVLVFRFPGGGGEALLALQGSHVAYKAALERGTCRPRGLVPRSAAACAFHTAKQQLLCFLRPCALALPDDSIRHTHLGSSFHGIVQAAGPGPSCLALAAADMSTQPLPGG